MEILVNGRFLGRPSTGVDRVAFELTRALMARGGDGSVEVTVVVPPSLVGPARDRLGDGVEVWALGRPPIGGHLWEQLYLPRVRPEAWLVGFCNTGPVARSRQAVVLHDAQFRTHPASYSARFRLWYSVLYPALSRRAQLAFTVSDYSRRELERLHLVPRSKLVVLHNGADHIDRIPADPETLARHGLEPHRYFLAVGSPAPHKNLATLRAAFATARSLRCELVLAGSVPPHVFTGQAACPQRAVRELGRVTDAELKALYASAIALCIPSLTEGFGLSAVEAMRCGTPVLAAAAGALPEVCGEAAVLLPPTDVAAWRAELERLAADPVARADLVAAGRQRAARFTWAESASALCRALAEADKAGLSRLDVGASP